MLFINIGRKIGGPHAAMSEESRSKRDNLAEEISVGDLVRLVDDEEVSVGVGLVLEIREDNKEVLESALELRSDFFLEEIPEYLLYNPVYLVLWHGAAITPTGTPVWMFRTELELIKNKE